MNFPSVIGIGLIAILALAKFYNAFNTIKKKGLKGFLTQKLIMLSVVAIIFGLFVLINPEFQFVNPKEILFDYIQSF